MGNLATLHSHWAAWYALWYPKGKFLLTDRNLIRDNSKENL
jgi:hypothetical protein